MGKLHAGIDDRLATFIAEAHVFFVATAPAGPGGHVNLSPKGGPGTFAVLGPWRFAYLDLTGSGAETVAHLRENGRITVMFCSFGPTPKVLRLYGRGRVVLPTDDEWPAAAAPFPAHRGARAVIDVAVERVADSCGYAVPLLEFAGERDLLDRWTERKSEANLHDYRARHNAASIDGLPGVPASLPRQAADRHDNPPARAVR